MNKLSPLYEWYVYFQILKKSFRPMKRTSKVVEKDYQKVWGGKYRGYTLNSTKLHPMKYNGKRVLCRGIDYLKHSIGLISAAIASLHPQNVIEVGSGHGMNLLALAVLHPAIKKLKGIDLSQEGVDLANSFLKNPPIQELTYLTGIENIKERLAGRDIAFVQGDILAIDQKEKFDVAFSHLVIEQMPHTYKKAFETISRVSEYALLIESFRECQSLFQLLNLRNVDYFRGSYLDAREHFKILKFEPLALQKLSHKDALLLLKSKYI